MTSANVGFSRLHIALHWAVVLLVTCQLLFAESMTRSVDAAETREAVSATDLVLSTSHYWFGLTILALAVLRAMVRVTRGVPAPASDQPRLMQLAATSTHFLFYLLLFAVPVLGLLAFYLGDPWGPIHSLAKPAFLVLIAIHAGAALFHQFFLKDGTLTRILRAND